MFVCKMTVVWMRKRGCARCPGGDGARTAPQAWGGSGTRWFHAVCCTYSQCPGGLSKGLRNLHGLAARCRFVAPTPVAEPPECRSVSWDTMAPIGTSAVRPQNSVVYSMLEGRLYDFAGDLSKCAILESGNAMTDILLSRKNHVLRKATFNQLLP